MSGLTPEQYVTTAEHLYVHTVPLDLSIRELQSQIDSEDGFIVGLW